MPLLELLKLKLSSGQSFSEFELMRWLQQPEQGIFRADALADSITLFQSHFILQNALYQIQQHWQQEQHAWLEISALKIQQHAWPSGSSQTQELIQANSLAEYYLDMANFDTSPEEVDALLNSFWQKMLLPEQRPQDLAILELPPSFNFDQLKRQYKKLAMRYHPDRGGDAQIFCQIQAAYQRLKSQFL